MTTETTDPLEQAIMEAAEAYASDHASVVLNTNAKTLYQRHQTGERLRLHVQLALAKARRKEHKRLCGHCADGNFCQRRAMFNDAIADLQARL